jgi:hypothetical protein
VSDPNPIFRSADPVGEAELDAFEAETGLALPADYRAFLLAHNGVPRRNRFRHEHRPGKARETWVTWLYPLGRSGVLDADAKDLRSTYHDRPAGLPAGLLPAADAYFIGKSGRGEGPSWVSAEEWARASAGPPEPGSVGEVVVIPRSPGCRSFGSSGGRVGDSTSSVDSDGRGATISLPVLASRRIGVIARSSAVECIVSTTAPPRDPERFDRDSRAGPIALLGT